MTAVSLRAVSKAYRLAPQLELKRLLTWARDEAQRRRAPVPSLRCALQDVSLELESGEAVGVIGPNGAGKTTLLRLIAGVTLPTHGRIRVQGRVSSLIALGTGFHGDLTGRENVYLYCALMGMTASRIRASIDEILAFADIGDHVDVAFKRYSSGMMARLGFAAAIHVEPGILLLDEVLAVGDQAFQTKSLGALEQLMARCTVVFVSHSLAAVERLCKRAIWLDGGRVRADGPTAGVVAAYLQSQAGPGAR